MLRVFLSYAVANLRAKDDGQLSLLGWLHIALIGLLFGIAMGLLLMPGLQDRLLELDRRIRAVPSAAGSPPPST